MARIPIANNVPHDDIPYTESPERNFIDVGGRTLSSLHFSLRDHSGNLIPLEEGVRVVGTDPVRFPGEINVAPKK